MTEFELEPREDGSIWLWHWVKDGVSSLPGGGILLSGRVELERLSEELNAYIKGTEHEPNATN